MYLSRSKAHGYTNGQDYGKLLGQSYSVNNEELATMTTNHAYLNDRDSTTD